jgi:sulfur carrier protein ThiS
MDTITVTVTEVPGTPTPVTLEEGSDVSDALEGADIGSNGDAEVQVNGSRNDMDDPVRDGDTVTVSQQISGA